MVRFWPFGPAIALQRRLSRRGNRPVRRRAPPVPVRRHDGRWRSARRAAVRRLGPNCARSPAGRRTSSCRSSPVGPADQHRAGQPPAGRAVGVVGRSVHARARPGSPPASPGPRPGRGWRHGSRRSSPRPIRSASAGPARYQASGSAADRPFRLVRLGEEEPVPPGGGEPRVGPGKCLADRDAVQHGEPADRLRVVHRQPEGDVAAPVVADHREPAGGRAGASARARRRPSRVCWPGRGRAAAAGWWSRRSHAGPGRPR